MRQQQQESEERELLDVELRNLRKRTQDVSERILIENECVEEAKRIISAYAETIDRHVDFWDEMYSRDSGVLEREIMALEQEEKLTDESHDELQVRIDQLNAQIDEHIKRQYEREAGGRPYSYYQWRLYYDDALYIHRKFQCKSID